MTNTSDTQKVTKVVQRGTIPNKAFDMEYGTQVRAQMEYLKAHGFEPTFVKFTSDYHIPTYKYTKTPQLFCAVASYYDQVRTKKQYSKIEALFDKADSIGEAQFLTPQEMKEKYGFEGIALTNASRNCVARSQPAEATLNE